METAGLMDGPMTLGEVVIEEFGLVEPPECIGCCWVMVGVVFGMTYVFPPETKAVIPEGIWAPGGNCCAITWVGVEELAPDDMCFETLPTCATFEDSPRVAVVWGCKTIRLGPGAAAVVVLLVVTTVDVPVAGEENICNRPSGI